MFTGLVQSVGSIAAREPRGGDTRLRVRTGKLDLHGVRIGDSICVSGVCLTATELTGDGFWCDVSNETLACTTLGALEVGAAVNLEKSLLPTTHLGGHFVSGHVDGVAVVRSRRDDGRSVRFEIDVPRALAKYVAAKGSVCLDGVSLTVNTVTDASFDVNIVPHTQAETTLGGWTTGTRVNVEVDLLARYVERLLRGAGN
jgi:riboflavin synthase